MTVTQYISYHVVVKLLVLSRVENISTYITPIGENIHIYHSYRLTLAVCQCIYILKKEILQNGLNLQTVKGVDLYLKSYRKRQSLIIYYGLKKFQRKTHCLNLYWQKETP
jgi:hypothetical protein